MAMATKITGLIRSGRQFNSSNSFAVSSCCLVARLIGSVAVWWPATSKSRRELAVVAVAGRSSGGGGGVEKHWFNSFGWSIQFSFAVGSEHVAMVARSIGSVVVWLSRLLFFTSKG